MEAVYIKLIVDVFYVINLKTERCTNPNLPLHSIAFLSQQHVILVED